jgi:hypothetical protein
MTYYMVTVWNADGDIVRELWKEALYHGKTKNAAQLYIMQLRQLFTAYEYTVRPVSYEQIKNKLKGVYSQSDRKL